MPDRDTTRINEKIRVAEVRVIDDEGGQVGILKVDDALKLAVEKGLDLVEVAPEASPPVCRILDYSKYKYELAQKAKAAKKGQKQITIREIKFRPKIAEHDYATKKGHVTRFLMHKDKVKVTIMFRGREVTHPELGRAILARLTRELEPVGTVEQRPNLDGRNMTMVLGPSKEVISGEITEFEPLDFSAEIAAAQAEADAEAFARSIAASAPPPRPAAVAPPAEIIEEVVVEDGGAAAPEVAEAVVEEAVEVVAEVVPEAVPEAPAETPAETPEAS